MLFGMAEGNKMEMGVVLVVMSMVCGGGVAESSCTSALLNLSACLNYTSTPSSSCCTQLATLVSSQPQCLCQLLNGGGSSLGLNINQTQALALPSACNVHTPPISLCNGTTTTQSPNWNPSGNGSPTTDNASSTLNLSIPLLLLVLAATYAPTFPTLFL